MTWMFGTLLLATSTSWRFERAPRLDVDLSRSMALGVLSDQSEKPYTQMYSAFWKRIAPVGAGAELVPAPSQLERCRALNITWSESGAITVTRRVAVIVDGKRAFTFPGQRVIGVTKRGVAALLSTDEWFYSDGYSKPGELTLWRKGSTVARFVAEDAILGGDGRFYGQALADKKGWWVGRYQPSPGAVSRAFRLDGVRRQWIGSGQPLFVNRKGFGVAYQPKDPSGRAGEDPGAWLQWAPGENFRPIPRSDQVLDIAGLSDDGTLLVFFLEQPSRPVAASGASGGILRRGRFEPFPDSVLRSLGDRQLSLEPNGTVLVTEGMMESKLKARAWRLVRG